MLSERQASSKEVKVQRGKGKTDGKGEDRLPRVRVKSLHLLILFQQESGDPQHEAMESMPPVMMMQLMICFPFYRSRFTRFFHGRYPGNN